MTAGEVWSKLPPTRFTGSSHVALTESALCLVRGAVAGVRLVGSWRTAGISALTAIKTGTGEQAVGAARKVVEAAAQTKPLAADLAISSALGAAFVGSAYAINGDSQTLGFTVATTGSGIFCAMEALRFWKSRHVSAGILSAFGLAATIYHYRQQRAWAANE